MGNGAAESPWKDRVQSIFSSGAVSSSSGLSASPLLEMLSVVGRFGVEAETRVAWVDGVEEGACGEVLVVVVLLVLVLLFWVFWGRVEE